MCHPPLRTTTLDTKVVIDERLRFNAVLRVRAFRESTMDVKTLPDFIIAGATKCGTWSMHRILAAHPQIFIPQNEVFFFSLDDFDIHRHVFQSFDDRWEYPDLEESWDEYFTWYQSLYADAPDDLVYGEDSPTYIASERALERIRRTLPDVRLLFILRDPVSRLYSRYWHALRLRRVSSDFEGTLFHAPPRMLKMGRYYECLRPYYDAFPRDQIKVVLFEDFIDDTQRVIDEVCAFVGCENTIDVTTVETHHNPSGVPRSIPLAYAVSWLRSFRPSLQGSGHVPSRSIPKGDVYARMSTKGLFAHFAAAALEALNTNQTKRDYPPMKKSTRDFLEHYYRRENSELSKLIRTDVSEYWDFMSERSGRP